MSKVLTEPYNKKKDQSRTIIPKNNFLANFFKHMGNVSELCKLVNISRQTYYDWLKKDKGFAKAIKDEEEGLIDFVESQAFSLIKAKNPTMCIFFLKCKGKDRGYIERQEFELSGGIKTDSALTVKVVQVKDEMKKDRKKK